MAGPDRTWSAQGRLSRLWERVWGQGMEKGDQGLGSLRRASTQGVESPRQEGHLPRGLWCPQRPGGESFQNKGLKLRFVNLDGDKLHVCFH